MSTLYRDTHSEAEAVLIRLLREAPPWRKVEMMAQMNETVKILMLHGLRLRYPDDPPELIRRRMADLLLGAELAERAYGPFPEGEDAD